MELHLNQHYFYNNELHRVNGSTRSWAYNLSKSIDTPDLNDVIIATGKVEVDDGCLYFDSNGYLDRDDGPAIDCIEHKTWYKHGYKHRIGGPADHNELDEKSDGWYVDGYLHRTDGPAITYPDGTEEWCVDGNHHRTNGPAITYSDGTEEWYRDGKLHRTDGPAVIHPDGTEEWWVNDEQVDKLTIMLLQHQTQSSEAVL